MSHSCAGFISWEGFSDSFLRGRYQTASRIILRASFRVRLVIIFTVVFSMASLAGASSTGFHVPTVTLAHAISAPCPTVGSAGSCSNYWIPAGPEMDTLLGTIFTDETAEFVNIQSASPSIDLTDWPLSSSLLSTFTTNPNFYITAPISEHGYFEIEFMLANSFWGIDMRFGNDTSGLGVQLRQGIAHLIDKVQFVNNEPDIAGSAIAIDNPVSTSNGGLPSPNPCLWDKSFPQTDSTCKVGAPGGTAYHRASATGGAHGLTAWQPYYGDADFCAAAQHFINAGLATGKDANCVLTGISTTVTSNTVPFFVRSDSPPRLALGETLAQEICALFGQGFVTGCLPYLSENEGPSTGFPGFTTSTTNVAMSWGMYTAGFGVVFPFDQSLYLGYNSRFVSGISSIKGGTPTAPCSSSSVPTPSAGDYEYMCVPSYDGLSNQMEFAPCLSASGDPVIGAMSNLPTSPGMGICPASNSLSAISAGIQAEDLFGKGAYTIPVFTTSDQFGYLQHTPGNSAATWQRVINNEGSGIASYFTWLNAWNPSPAQSGTVRQAFKQSTRTTNPYLATTLWDFDVVGSIYDSLDVVNPLSNGQLLDWMSTGSIVLVNSALTYTPPQGTVLTYRFTLQPNLVWQDGTRVTSWDVRFTYLSCKAAGAFQCGGLAPVTGVTVLTPSQFDINVNAFGPFTKQSLTSPTIIPGRYWSTCAGSIWLTDVSIGRVPDSCMSADPSKLTAQFDPIANHILIGSGPWTCGSGSGLGQACSPGNVQNPGVGQSYSLQRNGKGIAPSFPGDYFRSSGNLALWLWAGGPNLSSNWFSIAKSCFGAAPVTLGSTPTVSSCAHWQQGIGTSGATTAPGVGGCPSGTTPCGISVGTNQLSIIRLYSVPIDWLGAVNGNALTWNATPPQGIIPLNPILYAGNAPNPLPTGYPGFTPGAAQKLAPASTVGCASPYPIGAYDC